MVGLWSLPTVIVLAAPDSQTYWRLVSPLMVQFWSDRVRLLLVTTIVTVVAYFTRPRPLLNLLSRKRPCSPRSPVRSLRHNTAVKLPKSQGPVAWAARNQ